MKRNSCIIKRIVEKMENRKSFLINMLRKYLSKVRDDPKVRRILTPQEAENGLEIVIEKIVQKAIKKETELGRKLAFPEFQEIMMETLDALSPKVSYVV